LQAFFADQQQVGKWTDSLRAVVRAAHDDAPVGAVTFTGLTPSFSDYELLGEVGRGGMGVVYRARQKGANRLVALKTIWAGRLASADDVRRFRNEAEMVAALDHPHIVPIYDVGEVEGQLFFSMKLMDGGRLSDHLPRFQTNRRMAAQLVACIARAVHHAHQRGVLHRDLKPGNILLDAEGHPHVSDFGLARRVEPDSSLTQSGAIIGTPSYMAPEQASGTRGAITTATDVYGLGAVLYTILTGQPPFRGHDVLETLHQVREQEPPSPSAVNTQVDRDLATITLKCLRKEAVHRYASAAELAGDLERYLAGESIIARPPGRTARLWRWCRRNPLVASLTGTAALLVAILVVGLATGLAVIWQKEQKTAEALLAMEQSNKEAKAREAETRAVLDFVEDRIFAAARPEGQGLGNKVTLRKAVQEALPFVEKHFKDQPLIEARLRLTMGISFLELGDAKVASEQFEAARSLFLRHRGPEHAHTLASMSNLANSYAALGRDLEALRLRKETLALRQKTQGPDDFDTLQAMNSLGTSLAQLHRFHEAREVFEQTLALQRAKVGPHQPVTMSNLAACYCELNLHEEAIKLNKETLEVRKATLAPGHPDILKTMHNLATSYAALGRDSEALDLRKDTLRIQRERLDPDHPDTLMSMNNLADSYAALNRQQDALKLRAETLTLLEAKYTRNHPMTLTGMNNLAVSYAALGKHTEARKLFEETLDLRKTNLGHDHLDTILTMDNLARSYAVPPKHPDALKLREETLRLQRLKLGANQIKTLMSMRILAMNYAALKQHDKALTLWEEMLPLERVRLGPNNAETLIIMAHLVRTLGRLNRRAEAVPVIDEFFKQLAGQAIPPRLIVDMVDLRLRHFQNTKDVAGCRATAELWENLKRTDANSLYDAACMRAVTAAVLRATDRSPKAAEDASTEANRAMAWLTQAVAAGYKGIAHMKRDTDLDVLRDRADFQKLLAGLETSKVKDKP
jgi:tetratricopeptide (TPR) repeat protein